jgi:hypothetical protein
MTYPHTSPAPLPPAYPATVPGRRVFSNGAMGIGRDMVEKCEKVEGLQEVKIDFEQIFQPVNYSLPYGDDLGAMATAGTDGEGVTYVGNEKVWPEPVDKEESVWYTGEEKRWDDEVGQYPTMSNAEFLEYIADLAERQRLLTVGFFLLKSYGTDFVGRAGEL